jgi:hypothetical protein
MKGYSMMIPETFCPNVPPLCEHDFLYLGMESILFLSNYWKNISASRMGRAISNGDMDGYLTNADEARECREKSRQLAGLAPRAVSKPNIFNIGGPFKISDKVTCFVQDKADDSSGRLIEAVIMEVKEHKEGLTYSLWPYRKCVSATDSFKFTPDKLSIFPSGDVAYYRLHPHFLEVALELRAANDAERGKIKAILAAFSA